MMQGDAAIVEAWLSQHRVRRFATGDSSSPEALTAFLKERGYDIGFGWRGKGKATLRRIGQRGRPASMTMRELLALVDELRLTEGLPPILKPDSDIERELELWAA